MPTHQSQNLKRTNLYLVRVWDEGGSEGNSGGRAMWQGRVQRVVDGESHPFSNMQGLVDLLLEMLSGAKGDTCEKDCSAE